MSDDDFKGDFFSESEPDTGLPEQPNASDAGSLKKQNTRTKIHEREARTFWKSVFATEVGRREMWRLIQASHAFEERFACGPTGFPDPLATWFQAGEQALGQRIYDSWTIFDHEGVFLMRAEHDPRFAAIKPPKARA